MRIEWSPIARTTARRYMEDQLGMHAIVAAVSALTDDPLPRDGFHAGQYHRLRVGPYRIVYILEDDVITVSRVDRVTGPDRPRST